MKSIFAISLATVYGLSVRLLFGVLNDYAGIMSISFLMLVPMVIGFLTIILTSRKRTRNGFIAFFKPWLTSMVILVITILINVEGTICWFMIFPMFAILAGFGGLIAYFMRKVSFRKSRAASHVSTKNWDKPDSLKLSLIVIVPILIGLVEGDKSLITKEVIITKEVTIAASPGKVWRQLLDIDAIAKSESQALLANTLGFPLHIKTTLDTAAVGGKRVAYYERGLFFEEVISQYVHEKLMVLEIKTDPDKIPPGVMDEHIMIGGKYLDILEDVYKLEQLPNGDSKLILSSKFMINTPFNWYAGIWANHLMSGILQEELDLIKERSISS